MILVYCLPYMSQFDSHQKEEWRNRYFIDQCDVVCEKYKQAIDYVYTNNSQKKVKPGEALFMFLDEYKDICNNINLYNDNFVEREINLTFCLSIFLG
ncbi:unnamed protein product [Paramecium sonneborni]|uniref:Uncharacterized protein n=1 Tax=Paramecium sonneborni TaxID=65129 RepID=A0A8S1KUC1_9CILI|nr:unnamed protein product [Paramecium sonneborni]